uniref:Uncharacterized protein n=1 Tax=Brassica campestris TaxID=3711 RepID=M4FBD5_BRACM
MVQCFLLHDVYSQPQQSSRQRRQQILTEGIEEDDLFDFSDNDGDDIPQHNVPQTHEMKKYIVLTSMPIHFLHTNILTIQLGFLLEEVRNIQDVEVVQKELEDVGALLKRLLETQELMLEVLQEVIEEDNHSRLRYKTPLMDIKNFNDKVYNSYAQYFIDIARSNDEDKLQLLEAMTGVSRNNEDVPKQLGSGQLFGSPHSGGLSSGSPSSVGNCSRGNNFQNLGAPPTTQQWGTPPNVQHWGTPPNMRHWGTPPNVQYWGTSPNAQPWGVPPNGPSWNTPPNAQQWSTPPYPQQWNIPQNFYHGQQPSNVQQAGSSGTTPTNVHYGFTVGNQGGSPLNTQRNYSEGASIDSSPKVHQSPSTSIGFTNYFEPGSTSQRPRRGGLFNIWRTTEEPNEENQSGSGDEE